MTKEIPDKITATQNLNNIGIDPNNLNDLIKNANNLQDALRPHIVWDHKISIWCNILNKIFPVLQKYIVIIFFSWYFVMHAIYGETIQKILEFITTKVSDWTMLLIICSTLVSLSFIKHKWK